MDTKTEIVQQLEEAIELRQLLTQDHALLARIEEVAEDMVECVRNGNKILLAGNGGSLSDAQHIAAEFVGRFMMEREPLAAICMGTNSSTVTAVGNDYSFADIFKREVKAVGRRGDVFLAISTSGNSGNLIEAIKTAQSMGIRVFGLLGKGGGEIGKLVPSIVVPSGHTARIQELHITIGHILCDLVDKLLLRTK